MPICRTRTIGSDVNHHLVVHTKEGDIYIIQINDIVSARLYKTEEGKLRGEAPFFEGIWIIKER